jgi:hypothetical protein
MWEMRNACRILVGKPAYFGETGVYRRIIQYILKVQGMRL